MEPILGTFGLLTLKKEHLANPNPSGMDSCNPNHCELEYVQNMECAHGCTSPCSALSNLHLKYFYQ